MHTDDTELIRVYPWRYLTSTVAPASDSFCLIVSASSFETPSFTALGAASTRSFASFKPSAVTSRTTLITLILLPPTACRMTSNSVFSSATAAASPAAPPAAGAAATAAAAAETPKVSSNSFTSCEASRSVMFFKNSITSSRVAAMITFYPSSKILSGLLFDDLSHDHGQVTRHGGNHRDQSLRLAVDQKHHLRN